MTSLTHSHGVPASEGQGEETGALALGFKRGVQEGEKTDIFGVGLCLCSSHNSLVFSHPSLTLLPPLSHVNQTHPKIRRRTSRRNTTRYQTSNYHEQRILHQQQQHCKQLQWHDHFLQPSPHQPPERVYPFSRTAECDSGRQRLCRR